MNVDNSGDGARRVLEGARGEAERLGHDFIGAEHILLSLLRHDPAAEAALENLGLDAEVVRGRLESGGRRPRIRAENGELAYSSAARRLIEIASKEARDRNTELAPGHLLLAAVHEPRGPVARILSDASVTPARARVEVLRGMDGGAPVLPAPSGASRRGSAPRGESRSRRGETSAAERAPAERVRSEPQLLRSVAPRPKRRLPAWLDWRAFLLLAFPAAIVLNLQDASPVAIFAAACLAVLPLAGYMGEATEHLAHRTGPTIGGLLNATFGNAAELIIAVVALRAGLVDLVKASITGSILGNLLLILGLSIVIGSGGRPQLKFNRTSAGMSAAMLALAVVGLAMPAIFHALHPERSAVFAELRLSEVVAIILIITYAFSLLFSLRTHKGLFRGEAHASEGPVWGVGRAVVVLGLATVGVAVASEILVGATEHVTASLGLSQIFLGLIVIPIIGNAAEHAAAVVVARKGQIDLALQIALGSSTQIALLVAPLLVFAGLALGVRVDLVFRPFEVIALGLATAVVAIITLDGESHWFEGVQLIAVYAVIAAAAFFV